MLFLAFAGNVERDEATKKGRDACARLRIRPLPLLIDLSEGFWSAAEPKTAVESTCAASLWGSACESRSA